MNRQYMESVPKEIIDRYGIEEGQELNVSEEYLSAAIDTAYVSGLILVQQCWRKWDRADEDSIGNADNLVVNQLYDSLLERRFDLTTRLAGYTEKVKYRTDMSRRMAMVNHAIALKGLGRKKEMEGVLSGDWSSCALPFRIALHALKDEEDQFYELLPGAVAVGEVEKDHLEDWPLFDHLRQTERFREAFANCFPGDQHDEDGATQS